VKLTPAWRIGWAAALWLLGTGASLGDPWAPPGNASLRSDVQLLADEGIVRTPMTSWPLSWADVARDLASVRSTDLRSPSLADAYERLRIEARRQTSVGVVNGFVGASAGLKPLVVRGFEDAPREEGEVGAGVDWIGERVAARLQVRAVTSPVDGQQLRLDGSYVGVTVGNLMLSIGYMEKWWGPGWAGSLILSNNARPIPSITIERNLSTPFRLPVLKWIGSWRASFQAGRLEGSRRDHPGAHFMALRLSARPVRGLEIGVSRSAQLCGRGRECTGRTYWNMVLGRDNGGSLAKQPGNQLAGFDARWVAMRRVPVAVYGQIIGEDEAGGLPSKYLGLAGLETWGRVREWSVRGYAEYARTSCDFASARPETGCAYESGIYTDGYRYRGRAIGHAFDRDGEGVSVGFVAIRSRSSLTVRLQALRLLDAGRPSNHSLASAGGRIDSVDATFRTRSGAGRLALSVGYDRVEGMGMKIGSGPRAFVEWRNDV
jgi:hypothetical protein